MDNLLFSLNVVLPLFLTCAIGQLFRKLRLVDDHFARKCTNVVFYAAIPANIYTSLSGKGALAQLDYGLMRFVLLEILLLSALIILLIRLTVKDRAVGATVMVCVQRGNFAMLGIPLAQRLLGEQAATFLVLVPFCTLLFTGINVLTLAIFGKQASNSRWETAKKAMRSILLNPLILASTASILVAGLGLTLPEFVNTTIGDFAKLASCLSLFMLGAQLNAQELKGRLRDSGLIALGKLLVVPLAALGLAIAWGIRGAGLASVLILFATPTAVNCFALCDRMGGDSHLAGDSVLLTSCLCCVTVAFFLYVLKTLQLL